MLYGVVYDVCCVLVLVSCVMNGAHGVCITLWCGVWYGVWCGVCYGLCDVICVICWVCRGVGCFARCVPIVMCCDCSVCGDTGCVICTLDCVWCYGTCRVVCVVCYISG